MWKTCLLAQLPLQNSRVLITADATLIFLSISRSTLPSLVSKRYSNSSAWGRASLERANLEYDMDFLKVANANTSVWIDTAVHNKPGLHASVWAVMDENSSCFFFCFFLGYQLSKSHWFKSDFDLSLRSEVMTAAATASVLHTLTAGVVNGCDMLCSE